MFFSTYVLTKKGPLAKIWLAAHWDKKLTAKDIRVIDLNDTVVQIVQPAVPIALRTSGELMLGVVRIYAAKVAQLLKDANEVTLILRPRNIQIVKGAPGTKDGGAHHVTMDLVVGRAGTEQLVEADFEDIADILGTASGPKAAKRGPVAEAPEVVGELWFRVENSQLEDFSIANIGGDINNNPLRPGSSSTGTKSSSVQAPRNAALGDGLAELPEIPDVLPPGLTDMPAFLQPDAADLPALGIDLPGAPEQPQGAVKLLRRDKPVTMVDLAGTVLTQEVIERCFNDRHDIVCAERRHGPVDASEARDRHTLRLAADGGALTTCSTTVHVANPALAEAFVSSLRASFKHHIAALEIARGGDHVAEGRTTAAPEFHAEDPLLPPVPGAGDDPFQFDYLPPEELPDAPRESARRSGTAEKGQGKLSASTSATLERLKQILSSARGGSTKFSTLTRGDDRIAVARTFVDVLSLASLNIISVAQAAPRADITISAGPKLVLQAA